MQARYNDTKVRANVTTRRDERFCVKAKGEKSKSRIPQAKKTSGDIKKFNSESRNMILIVD
jgi:hypothetical protein